MDAAYNRLCTTSDIKWSSTSLTVIWKVQTIESLMIQTVLCCDISNFKEVHNIALWQENFSTWKNFKGIFKYSELQLTYYHV